MNINDRKLLGYYTVNGIEFESKIQAAFYAIKTKSPFKSIQWHFNDEIFSRHNWSIEPTSSLDELYDRRSKDIRQKYDYVILSYSGGADSHNILCSFVRQGLHIDEIIVNNMDKANSKFTDINSNNIDPKNAAAEYHLQTLPRLKELAPYIPKTKITVCDLSDHLFDYMNNAKDASWVLTRKEGLNPANVTRFNYLHFNDVRKQFDKSKSIVLLLGVDKPRVYIKDNYMHIRFADRAANIIPVPEHLDDYDNTTVDFFYWSPYSLDILTKQVHVIKRWLKSHPEFIDLFEPNKMSTDMRIYRWYHERLLRTVVYSTWDNNWYQADKAIKDWTSEFDQWFEDGYQETSAYKIWLEGIDYIKDTLYPFTNENNGDLDGLKIIGKNYKVCKFNDSQF